jgi:hypothetical protein
MRSFRPRISLLSALFLLTIAGMAIFIVQLWREVGPLRAEVRRLRDEVGAISIDDPTQVHAIQIETSDDLLWKWRIWLPENRVYVLRSNGEDVPKKGYAQATIDGGSRHSSRCLSRFRCAHNT